MINDYDLVILSDDRFWNDRSWQIFHLGFKLKWILSIHKSTRTKYLKYLKLFKKKNEFFQIFIKIFEKFLRNSWYLTTRWCHWESLRSLIILPSWNFKQIGSTTKEVEDYDILLSNIGLTCPFPDISRPFERKIRKKRDFQCQVQPYRIKTVWNDCTWYSTHSYIRLLSPLGGVLSN